MTIAAISPIQYPPAFQAVNPRTSVTNVFDAVGDKTATVFVWEHDDAVIDVVAIKVMGVSGTNHTISLEVWTVDPATDPNEPLTIISGASVTQVVTASDDFTVYALTLGTPPTLVRGTSYAVVVRMTVYGSASLSIALADQFEWPSGIRAPYTMNDLVGSGWAIDFEDFLVFSLGEQTTGTYRVIGNSLPPGNDGFSDNIGPADILGQQNINTGASKDEVGNIFQVPVPMRTGGCWLIGEIDGDVTVKLTSDPLGTPKLERSYSLDQGYRASTTENLMQLPWATDFELAADTDYALTVVAESATAVQIPVANCHTAAMLGCYPGGTTWIFCDRDGVAIGADGGVFTKTATKRCCGLGLMINGLEDGAGGGGGSGPIITKRRRVM